MSTGMKITDLVMPGWLEMKTKYVNQESSTLLIKACKVLLIKESSFSCSLIKRSGFLSVTDFKSFLF